MAWNFSSDALLQPSLIGQYSIGLMDMSWHILGVGV
jgi:hypothetical protein